MALYRQRVIDHGRAERARTSALVDAVLELREAGGLTVAATGRALGISRKHVHNVLTRIRTGSWPQRSKSDAVRPIGRRATEEIAKACSMTDAELDALERRAS